MHVLVAHRAAVRLFEPGQDLTQRLHRTVFAQEALHFPSSNKEISIHIVFREPVQAWIERDWHLTLIKRQWIEIGDAMSANLIRADQHHQPHGFLNRLRVQRSPHSHRRRTRRHRGVHFRYFSSTHARICLREKMHGILVSLRSLRIWIGPPTELRELNRAPFQFAFKTSSSPSRASIDDRYVPICLNNDAHDSGTLFGSFLYSSSIASKYAALEAFKKSSLISRFGVGFGGATLALAFDRANTASAIFSRVARSP